MKKNKILIIASVVAISLVSFVGCGSKEATPENAVESNTEEITTEATDEEVAKYDQAATLYESGDAKEQEGDLEGAVADYEEAIILVDELLQIDNAEEYTAFKKELETRIENIKSGDTANQENSEETSAEETSAEETSTEETSAEE